MLRQQMIRSLKRPAFRAALNGSRALSASARRPADIELTIGLCHSPLRAARYANGLCRWKEGVSRRYEAGANPLVTAETVLTRSYSRLVPHPSLRPGRSYRPPILLPREVDDCWIMSYVLGRGGAGAQARRLLRMARTARHGCQDRLSSRPQGA